MPFDRPPAPRTGCPLPAETARTLLVGAGTATLRRWDDGRSHEGRRAPEPVPVLHAGSSLDEDARAFLLVPRDAAAGFQPRREPGRAEGAGDVVAVLDVVSWAPLADRALPRAALEVAGWVRPPDGDENAEALEALAARYPLAELLAGWGRRTLLVLDPADARLHCAAGCLAMDAADLVSASPDPLAPHEATALDRLRHLLGAGLLRAVARLVPAVRGCAEARPVGVDRYGFDVECRWAADPSGRRRSTVVRLPFPAPADDVESAVAHACRALAGV